jgi:3-hydroxyisobutyrate dehydrogenase-like beta-hydroxyacid dehydrogenase
VRAALIGAGLMGAPMARRLLGAGHEVVVYGRTRARAETLAPIGARVAPSGPAALAAAPVAILMLRDGPAIEATLWPGGAAADFAGRTVIQMGTIAPAESRDLQRRVVAGGGDYLEAPVLGSIPQAESGRLIVMVGATAGQFDRWRGLLGAFSPAPRHVGAVGQAAVLKLCLNQMIASLMSSFALGIGMTRRAGLPVETFMDILRESALHARTFDNKLDAIRSRNFSAPHFTTSALLKDIDLALAEARALGLEPAALAGVREAFALAVGAGLGDLDYSSVYAKVDPRD